MTFWAIWAIVTFGTSTPRSCRRGAWIAAAGTYTVCLTVTDVVGGCTDTYCDNVVITTPGHLPCEASFTSIASGLTVDFTGANYANNAADTYDWVFGDDSLGTGETVNHEYSQSGSYFVCLTVTEKDAFGVTVTCTDTYCDSVTVSNVGIGEVVLRNLKLSAYPNPFSNTTVIEYTLVNKSNIGVVIYDLLGNAVETIVNTAQAQGIYRFNYDAAKLARGMYMLKVNVDGKSTGKLLVKE